MFGEEEENKREASSGDQSKRAMPPHAEDPVRSGEGTLSGEGGTPAKSEESSWQVSQEQEELRELVRARPEEEVTPHHQEVALLIDGENVSSHDITEIVFCAQNSGEVR